MSEGDERKDGKVANKEGNLKVWSSIKIQLNQLKDQRKLEPKVGGVVNAAEAAPHVMKYIQAGRAASRKSVTVNVGKAARPKKKTAIMPEMV